MTAIRIDLGWLLRRQPAEESRDRVAALLETTEEAIVAVRRLCADLRPPVLEVGLGAAMEAHLARTQAQLGIPCCCSVVGDERGVPDRIAQEVFRVLQEAVTNVARHAEATRIDVRLELGAEAVRLAVVDDGVGLPTPGAQPGLGLVGMSERALRLGATLTLDAPPEGGSRVLLEVPLPRT
jgi:signal transduction histidine kinase